MAIPSPDRLLRAAFQAAVDAARPEHCVPPALPRQPGGRTLILGAGKAAAAMARAVETHWDGELGGMVVTARGHAVACERIEVIEAAHPVPAEAGQRAAERMLDRPERCGAAAGAATRGSARRRRGQPSHGRDPDPRGAPDTTPHLDVHHLPGTSGGRDRVPRPLAFAACRCNQRRAAGAAAAGVAGRQPSCRIAAGQAPAGRRRRARAARRELASGRCAAGTLQRSARAAGACITYRFGDPHHASDLALASFGPPKRRATSGPRGEAGSPTPRVAYVRGTRPARTRRVQRDIARARRRQLSNAPAMAFWISSGVRSFTCVAIDHEWPNGSRMRP